MDRFLYAVIGGFLSGVLWRSIVDFGFAFSFFIVFLGFVVLLMALLSRERIVVVLVGVLLISGGLGMARFDLSDLHRGSDMLDQKVGTSIRAEGIVIDEPDKRETNTNYTVLLDHISKEPVSEKVRVVAESYPAFSYGDRIHISGELQKPKGFQTDDDRYFDYATFLSKDDIFYQMIYPQLEFVSGGEGNVIKQYLFAFKNAFLLRVQALIPDPHAALLGGLVVGAKQSLGEKLQDDFRATGIVHIVVLSGYNVTIVADFITRLFLLVPFLPHALGVSLGALSIVLFALMTGASATIVRASIMALLVIVAKATGRTYDITRALFIAGFFMVLHNPKILLHDASFQLSFLATLGLITLAPLLERYFSFVPKRFQLREFATATIATQIFVLPLLLYKVGQLSLVALPVNLLVLITVPAAMLSGFLTGIVGFLSTTLALPFAFISYLVLSYQLLIVGWFAKLPFASVHIAYFPLWLTVVVYLLYIYLLVRRTVGSHVRAEHTDTAVALT